MQASFEADAAAIKAVRASALELLAGMAEWAVDLECRSCLHEIAAAVNERLCTILDLARSGRIRPSQPLRLAEQEAPGPAVDRTLRAGIYPLAANPMHWGHILVALDAMAALELDKVAFVIAGSDSRKPRMTPAETRHSLARSVLESFSPIFAYSPVALGTDLDGETNFGRLLSFNANQGMEACYIAGMDHYRRRNDADEPDTIEKLERIVGTQVQAGNRLHAISLAFVARGRAAEGRDCRTFLKVHLLPPLPFALSSTAARRALCSGGTLCDAVMSLPYACLLPARAGPMASRARECFDGAEMTAAP